MVAPSILVSPDSDGWLMHHHPLIWHNAWLAGVGRHGPASVGGPTVGYAFCSSQAHRLSSARGDFGDELIVQRLDSMLTSCGGMEGMLAKFGEEIGTQEDTAS